MTMQIQKKKHSIYAYDRNLVALHRQIKRLLSPRNAEFILKYDREMVQLSLAKATRRKHLEVLCMQSRQLKSETQMPGSETNTDYS